MWRTRINIRTRTRTEPENYERKPKVVHILKTESPHIKSTYSRRIGVGGKHLARWRRRHQGVLTETWWWCCWCPDIWCALSNYYGLAWHYNNGTVALHVFDVGNACCQQCHVMTISRPNALVWWPMAALWDCRWTVKHSTFLSSSCRTTSYGTPSPLSSTSRDHSLVICAFCANRGIWCRERFRNWIKPIASRDHVCPSIHGVRATHMGPGISFYLASLSSTIYLFPVCYSW